jgi:glucose-6-phosphate 1-dehydrogenase
MAGNSIKNGSNDMIEVQQQGMLKGNPPDPCIVVIFGASGDLAHKELVPSLFALNCHNLMPKQCAVIGFSRTEYSDDEFRKQMFNAVKKDSICGEDQWNEFAKNLFYVPGNFKDGPSESYKKLKKKISELQKKLNIPDNILFHLSTAPSFYSTIVKKLSESGLSKSSDGWRRVIIEKPFGTDEKSARELDRDIHEVFEEDQIFRIDHFLGKETVQNMVVFRFANPGFEPIWNRNYIDNIQITVAEDIGIGSRAGFYEKTGVIRDMIQNHLFELLCMTAIDPPVNYDGTSLRSETLKVLNSICKIDVEKDVILGQYDAGTVKGEQVDAYRDEKDVDKKSMTPTYAAIKLTLDSWRWAGVPVYLRTGKRMKEKLSEITIKFKPTPHLMFPINIEEEKKHNLLTFRLQPNEGILYTFTAKQPGAELQLRPVNLNFRYDRAFGIKEPPSSYQWLIRDAMQGDQTLFPHAEWIYKSWQIVDPIIKKWEAEPWLDFPNYKAGKWGPKAADKLIRKNNNEWNAQ